ncbi:group II intron-associated open reading frame [Beggiatoa sp. PS]|nr:group II intron-associated open reading frame [Beggiatoa sp. PS]
MTVRSGKKTAGLDGQRWNTPKKKIEAIEAVSNWRCYRPFPLKRVYIPKKNGKKRPLGIPAMVDRAKQALYLQALAPVAETTADCNSYGFRPNRQGADAIEQCFILLARKSSAQSILEGDIKHRFSQAV